MVNMGQQFPFLLIILLDAYGDLELLALWYHIGASPEVLFDLTQLLSSQTETNYQVNKDMYRVKSMYSKPILVNSLWVQSRGM